MRVGLRGDDAWAPKHVMVIGRAQADFTPGRVLALAMETDIERWLSADSDEGPLTMPVRRVGAGTSTTIIRRVLLLIYTDRGDDIDTESDIKLQIAASGQLMLDQKITHDFDQVRALLALPHGRAALHPRRHSLQGRHPPQHPGHRRLAADDGLRLRVGHGRRATERGRDLVRLPPPSGISAGSARTRRRALPQSPSRSATSAGSCDHVDH